MKLHLVGTGAIGVKERSACSLVDDRILIDCGNGNVKTLIQQGIDISNIDVILITHLHADHFFDLPFFILTKSFNKPQKITKIYSPKGTEKIVEELFDRFMADGTPSFQDKKKAAMVEFHEFENLENEQVLKDYFVKSFIVDHSNTKPVYGYILKNNNKSIGFSGDSTYCENINKILEDSDIAVLDMSFPERNKMHMGVDDIEIICKKYKNKNIVATHMSNPARQLAKEKAITNLLIPNDGDEFEI